MVKVKNLTKNCCESRFKTLSNIIAFVVVMLLLATPAKSQNTQLRSTRIYGTLGTAFVYTNFTGNIEQEFLQRQDKFFTSISLRIGGGYWSSWSNESYNFIGTANWLSGTNNHHLELGTGIAYSPAYDESLGFLPAAQIGYRYQKPGGVLLFRAGIGVPEAIYVSLGVCF